jgi:hypothetical protein
MGSMFSQLARKNIRFKNTKAQHLAFVFLRHLDAPEWT